MKAPRVHVFRLEVKGAVARLEARGHTLSLLVEGKTPLALLAFQDAPREEARAVLGALKGMGLRLHLLTGDREEAALALVRALDLEAGEVEAGLSPEDKLRRVAALAEDCLLYTSDAADE